MKKLIQIILLFGLSLNVVAQDIGELGIKKGVKVNGSVTVNTIGYKSWGIESRRDPFTWYVSGNLNLNLFGYSAPVSFSYSNTNKSFTQPFNQFSFAPQYKWVKVLLGYNSMTFSPYTLAGHVFLGGGVELTPGKWRFSGMYGRLKKSVGYDYSDSTMNSNNVSYKRMGYGAKAGYDDGANALSFNFFYAKDDTASLPFVLPNSTVTPKENFVFGISGKKQLFSKFFLEGEYAYSILNNNTRSHSVDSATLNNIPGGSTVTVNNSTRYYSAYNAGLGYQGSFYSIILKYERIDPEYQTLGAYYFNNDMENYTLAPSVSLFNSRVNFSGNIGVQKNNLDKNKESTTRRMVGALNGSYAPKENLSFTAGYSNFSTFTNIRPLNDPFFRDNMDTLNFYQLSSTWSASSSYGFGGNQKKQNIMLSLSYQQAKDVSAYQEGNNTSSFYTGNVSYGYSIVPLNTTISSGMNYYLTEMPSLKSAYWGPSVSASRTFFEKKLKTSVSTSYNRNTTQNSASNSVINSRLGLNYSINAKPTGKEKKSGDSQNVSFNLLYLKKFAGGGEETPKMNAYSEITANFTYTYSF